MSKKNKMWTIKEELFLKDNADKISMSQAIEHLNRDKHSIRCKLYQLGLKLLDEWSVTEYAYYNTDGEYVMSGTVYDIAKATGINVKILKTYTYRSMQKRLKRTLIKLDEVS